MLPPPRCGATGSPCSPTLGLASSRPATDPTTPARSTMNCKHLILPGLILLAPLSRSVASLPAAQDGMKASDHKALGKDLAEYVEAWNKNKGLDAARAAVAENLEKLK